MFDSKSHQKTMLPYKNDVPIVKVLFNPVNENLVGFIKLDNGLYLIDRRKSNSVLTVSANASGFDFSPDGNSIAFIDNNSA